jgi:cytochrome c peroxidase
MSPGSSSRLALLGLILLAACTDQDVVAPEPSALVSSLSEAEVMRLSQLVRKLTQERGITPMPSRADIRDGLAQLGQMLLFDKILSGNKDISCMSCHHPKLATGDARSLAIGQGASGVDQ